MSTVPRSAGQPPLGPPAGRGGVDASVLPTEGFGAASVAWWGTIGFMVIEGTTLAVCLATYIYLGRNFDAYPPPGYPLPGLLLPLANMLVMLLSVPVAIRTHRAAHAHDRDGIVRYAGILLVFGVVILVLRAFELDALNVRWDSNAYGSIVWFTIGFHSFLLLVDFAESLAIFLIFALRKQEKKHYGDAADDVEYWYFIVASWLVLFVVLFLLPRVY